MSETKIDFDQQIAQAERRLSEIRQQLERLSREAAGWEALANGARLLKEADGWHAKTSRVVLDLDTRSGTVVLRPESPRGEAAVLSVLKEHGEMSARDVAEIIINRGWIDSEAKDKAAAVNSALHRLVKKHLASRVATGVYAPIDSSSSDEPEIEPE